MNAQTFLKRMTLKVAEDLTKKNKSLMKLQEKKVTKYEAYAQAKILPIIVGEGTKRSVRRL